MMNRRNFIAASAGGFLLSRLPVTPRSVQAAWTTIAYNILECQGWTAQKDTEKKGPFAAQVARRIALELSLYDPSIVNFSESPAESVIAEIARLMGMNYVFFPSGEKWPGALLTKWTILESRNCPVSGGERPKDLFTRHWGMARLRNGN